MRIDFNEIASMTFPGMDNGTGTMSARMYNDDSYRIITTAIHPGGSIGKHKQNSGDDINYIITGTGKALCDGVEESITKKHQKPRKKKLKISVMLTKISNCHNSISFRLVYTIISHSLCQTNAHP